MATPEQKIPVPMSVKEIVAGLMLCNSAMFVFFEKKNEQVAQAARMVAGALYAAMPEDVDPELRSIAGACFIKVMESCPIQALRIDEIRQEMERSENHG